MLRIDAQFKEADFIHDKMNEVSLFRTMAEKPCISMPGGSQEVFL